MWTLGSPVPEFAVRTSAGIVGPASFRGAWLALLHRPAPPSSDRVTCVDRCDVLARRLAERDCALLVAFDDGDAGADLPPSPQDPATRLLPDRTGTFRIGLWLAGAPPPAHAPRLAIVDPRGVLRAFEEADDEHAFVEWDLLARVDRVLCTVPPHAPAGSAEEAFGCVEWFDYAPPPHAALPDDAGVAGGRRPTARDATARAPE